MRIVLLVVVVMLLLASSVLGSSGDLPAIKDLILSIDPYTFPEELDSAERGGVEEVDYFGQAATQETINHRMYRTFESIVAFAVDPAVLWPGCVVEGDSLKTGRLTSVGLSLSPQTITISNLQFAGSNSSYSAVIQQPSKSAYETELRKLLSQPLAGPQSARLTFYQDEFCSLEQGMMAVGASASWLTGDMSAQFNKTYEKRKSSLIVRVNQPYYDVSVEDLPSPETIFAETARLSDAQRHMAKGNPPAWISSVTYGRMLFFVASADVAMQEFKETLDVAFSSGFVDGSLQLSNRQKQVLQSSTITLVALGGGTEAAVRPIVGDIADGIKTYLSEGANFSAKSPGYPISYTVKYLCNNKIAKLAYTTTYKSYDYTLLPSLKSLEFRFTTNDDDKDREEAVEVWVRSQDWKKTRITKKVGPFTIPIDVYTQQGTEIANGKWGLGEKWPGDDGVREKVFRIDLQQPVLVRDIPKLAMRLMKHPNQETGCGWDVSIAVKGIYSDGHPVTLFEWFNTRLGDDKPYNFYNLKFRI